MHSVRDRSACSPRRICGEPTGLGHKITPSTIRESLKAVGIDPQHAAGSWKHFLSAQAKAIAAVDFLPADTVFLCRLGVSFVTVSDTDLPLCLRHKWPVMLSFFRLAW